jgi:hypothetical protein
VLDYIQLRWKLWRTHRSWSKLDAKYTAALEEAKKRKAAKDEIESVEAEFHADYFDYCEQVETAHSQFLCKRASRLIIPLPKFDDSDMWEDFHDGSGRHHLTETGINALRAAIRAERKARLDMFLMWVPGIVGILGALIGLVSVLSGKK